MSKVKASEYIFPSVSTEAAKVNKKIDSVVNLMHEIEILKQDIATVCEDAEDKYDIPKALVKKYATIKFDQNKAIDALETQQRLLDDLNIDTNRYEGEAQV